MTAPLGAEGYVRGVGRTGYRNGGKPQAIVTRVATLELRVPQDQHQSSSHSVMKRSLR